VLSLDLAGRSILSVEDEPLAWILPCARIAPEPFVFCAGRIYSAFRQWPSVPVRPESSPIVGEGSREMPSTRDVDSASTTSETARGTSSFRPSVTGAGRTRTSPKLKRLASGYEGQRHGKGNQEFKARRCF
jgi:hypothetical protein